MSAKEVIDDSLNMIKLNDFVIILQRFSKNILCQKTYVEMGEDDSHIEVRRRPPLQQKMIRAFNDNLKCNFEDNAEIIEHGDLAIDDETVSDSYFRAKCHEAMHLCKKYCYIYFFLEKISKISTVIAPCFMFFVEYTRKINVISILIAMIIFVMIAFIDIFGDWERLREKYAHLYYQFSILSNSKSPKRVIEFRKNAISFSNGQLFIDTIIFEGMTTKNI